MAVHKFHAPISWFWKKYLDDDRILLDVVTDLFMKSHHIEPSEMRMSEDLSGRIAELGSSAAQGAVIPWEMLQTEMNRIAEEHGCEYGLPIPAMGEMKRNYLVMARGVPLRHILTANHELAEYQERQARMQRGDREAAQELINSGMLVRNSWDVIGNQTICVLQTSEGPMALPRYHSVQRLAKLFNTLGTRIESQLTVDAELKAQALLKTKISEAQWRCYVLNDCFLERSPRSDLHYLFRKGYPTIALSYHGYPEGRALAALCLHPMGYFQFTHAGLMTPTDEVICHVLMMRADEHKFWAKSGQWAVTDTRSGL